MRLLVAALVVSALAGSAAAATSSSGLRGFVTRSPITPVCVAGKTCAAPAKGVTLIFSRNGRAIGHVTTSGTGSYRVTLDPGLYSAKISGVQALGRRLTPARAGVIAGRYRRVDFAIDTGIR
jgi:hypothetical protein